MSSKYDQYVHHPPHLRLSMKSNNSIFFDGLMVKEEQLGHDFTFGHQFVRKPFKGDNPCHTHNFWEFMAWYGSNPEDPNDFQAEVVFYFGKELEKHVFTRPTIISLPPGLPHHPFEITRVDSPIIQIEIMIGNKGLAVDPCFEKDKGWSPATKVNREYL
jgi:hypothetical protein